MLNYPKDLRRRVTSAMLKNKLIIPLYDSGILISEEKAKAGKLKDLYIQNIPNNSQDTKSFLIDLELNKSFFAKPNPETPHIKTVEKALVFFTSSSIYVLLIEMKESLMPFGTSGLETIEQKIKDSITRTDIILSYFVPDFNVEVQECDIQYKTLICYNKEFLTQEIKRPESRLLGLNMYKVFKEGRKEVKFTNDFGGNYRTKIFFEQNPDSNSTPQKMYIDLNNLFQDDYDFENWIYATNLTFPF